MRPRELQIGKADGRQMGTSSLACTTTHLSQSECGNRRAGTPVESRKAIGRILVQTVEQLHQFKIAVRIHAKMVERKGWRGLRGCRPQSAAERAVAKEGWVMTLSRPSTAEAGSRARLYRRIVQPILPHCGLHGSPPSSGYAAANISSISFIIGVRKF
jgi:hypothetical protein